MPQYAQPEDFKRFGFAHDAIQPMVDEDPAFLLSHLQAASGYMDNSLICRFTLPLQAQPGGVEFTPSVSDPSVSVWSLTTQGALGSYVSVVITTSGVVGAPGAVMTLSVNGRVTDGVPVPASGVYLVPGTGLLGNPLNGIKVAMGAGNLNAGDEYDFSTTYNAEITQNVCLYAAFMALRARGFAPGSAEMNEAKVAYQDAIAWAKGVRDGSLRLFGVVDSGPASPSYAQTYVAPQNSSAPYGGGDLGVVDVDTCGIITSSRPRGW